MVSSNYTSKSVGKRLYEDILLRAVHVSPVYPELDFSARNLAIAFD